MGEYLHAQNCGINGDSSELTGKQQVNGCPCDGHRGRKPWVSMTWSQLHSGRSSLS